MNVLLVDDDVEMLESMRRMTLTMGDGWNVAGLAEDGVEALELLRGEPVDILVTDITMLDMDGLELIEKAREQYPELRSLLITCHEDFQYAQAGIKLGVEDYLVKYTLTEKKFHQALARTKEKIEAAQNQRDSLTHLSTEVYKNREHFRETLINAALNESAEAFSALAERAPLYGITLPRGAFTVSAVFLNQLREKAAGSSEKALVRYAVMNVAQELIAFAPSFAFPTEETVFLLLWDTGEGAAWRAALAGCLSELRGYFQARFHMDLSAVAGSRAIRFPELKKTMQSLLSLRDRCFYDRNILLEEEAGRLQYRTDPVPGQYLEAVQEVLYDFPRLRETMDGVFQELERARFSPVQVRSFFNEVILQLQIVANYAGSSLPAPPQPGETFAICKKQLDGLLQSLRDLYFWNGGQKPGKDILQVVEYVNGHLNAELKLEQVADVVHKNSSYLSRQFKKETGLSFSEFVTRQRIRRATYLLEQTDLPMERIAEEIGVANSQYFSTLYKRETNRSPREVRRQTAERPAQ